MRTGRDVETAKISSMASTRNRNGYSYIYGNLDHTSTTKSWSPYYTNGNQYLEFRLSEPYYVTGFDTKGDTYSNSWVTKIKFLFYNDTSAMWVCKFWLLWILKKKTRFEMILKEISAIVKIYMGSELECCLMAISFFFTHISSIFCKSNFYFWQLYFVMLLSPVT